MKACLKPAAIAAFIVSVAGCASTNPELNSLPPAPLKTGWQRYETPRVSIGLPPGWVLFDLKRGGLPKLVEFLRPLNAKAADGIAAPLKAAIETADEVLFALNQTSPEASSLKFENMNLMIMKAGGSLDSLVQGAVSPLESATGTKFARTKIVLPIGEAVEYRGSGTAPGTSEKFYIQGYVLANKGEGVTVSFGASKASPRLERDVRAALESLRVKTP